MEKTGWILTTLLGLFLLGASVAPKLLGMNVAVDSLVSIGWPTTYVFQLGLLELVITVLFLISRTGLLEAVLMTGLLGGAMASHLRAGSPLFGFSLFGLYLGIALWLALFLRDGTFRAYVTSTLMGNRGAD